MRPIDADDFIERFSHTPMVQEALRIAMDKMPTIEPERKKGKWIAREGRDDCFECSECHAVIEGNEVYWRNNYFCYHCGADMR